jgi:ring-1,2-phenylacetyl-CoA epoxidase subunit PaaD
VEIRLVLAPPWSTDRITDAGRRKLARAGIAPPAPVRGPRSAVPITLAVSASPPCPRCGSARTDITATFGATACLGLHRCHDCAEPFEAVRPL